MALDLLKILLKYLDNRIIQSKYSKSLDYGLIEFEKDVTRDNLNYKCIQGPVFDYESRNSNFVNHFSNNILRNH